MVRLGRLSSVEGEYFQFRNPAKFISEVLIAISTIVGISSIGTLVGFSVELHEQRDDGGGLGLEHGQRDITIAMLTFTVVILIVSISDIVFAVILRSGIQKLKLSYCLFWKGATITSLILVGMLTIAFITMVRDLTLTLGYLPSLVSKPFSLWMVNGFILELGELRTFPANSDATVPPAKPTLSLDDLESLKKTTTVFHMKKKKFGSTRRGQSPYIVTSKLGSIPETE